MASPPRLHTTYYMSAVETLPSGLIGLVVRFVMHGVEMAETVVWTAEDDERGRAQLAGLRLLVDGCLTFMQTGGDPADPAVHSILDKLGDLPLFGALDYSYFSSISTGRTRHLFADRDGRLVSVQPGVSTQPLSQRQLDQMVEQLSR